MAKPKAPTAGTLHVWERIIRWSDDGAFEETDRMRVPGGWLYRVTTDDNSSDGPPTVCMCFVPEPPAPRDPAIRIIAPELVEESPLPAKPAGHVGGVTHIAGTSYMLMAIDRGKS